MDISGDSVYNLVRNGAPEQKHDVLQSLKTHVKKDNVNLQWVGRYFEALSIATDAPDRVLQTVAFSVVCHLVKRVSIQDPRGAVLSELSFLVLPILITRITDTRSSVKISSKRALEAYWLTAPQKVNQGIREIGLSSRSSLLVNECVVWLNYILTNVSPSFKLESFLDCLARALRDHASDTKLVSNIRVLFENYYDLKENSIRKFDLQKALENSGVPASLRLSLMGTESIITQSNAGTERTQVQIATPVPSWSTSKFVPSSNSDMAPKTHSRAASAALSPPALKTEVSHKTPPARPQTGLQSFLKGISNYEFDTSIEPQNVADASEIFHIAAGMTGHFESRETERNWSSREKNILKLRALIRGNAPSEYTVDFLTCIRDLQDGICKSLSSLRTTLSINSCQFVKDMALQLGVNFEPLTDLFVPTLIKLCSSTKHLLNSNAHVAICAILAQTPLSSRLLSRISNAAFEKSVNTKAFACSWLQIYIMRSHDQWKEPGSDIADKMLLKLLPDPNMQVRSAAKDAYWKYYEYSEQSAADLRSQLDSNVNRALERSRPKGAPAPSASSLMSSTGLRARPSLKESIPVKKRDTRVKSGELSSVTRSASRNGPTAFNGFSSNLDPTDLVENQLEATTWNDKGRRQESRNPSYKREVKSSLDSFLDMDSGKQKNSAEIKNPVQSTISTPEQPAKRYNRPFVSPKTASEPHYAQPTFSHPSSSTSQENRKYETSKQFPVMQQNDETPVRQKPTHMDARPGPTSRSPNQDSRDPIFNFLRSADNQILNEGVLILRNALIGGDGLPDNLTPILQKLSVTNPFALKPLFDIDEILPKRVFKLFAGEDFLRSCCVLLPPTQESFDCIISLFTVDDFYPTVETMLSYVLELTDIVADGSLIMQLIKFKDRILAMLLKLLVRALSKIPITDVNFSKLTSNLFELIPVAHQTNLVTEYKTLLHKLNAINSKLFVSQLSSVSKNNKSEIEHMVGIDDSLEFKPMDATLFNLTEFTRISPAKSFEQFSPLKFPSDFTMLLPGKAFESGSPVRAKAAKPAQDTSSSKKQDGLCDEDQRIRLEDPPLMKIVSEDDVAMDEVEDNKGVQTKAISEDDNTRDRMCFSQTPKNDFTEKEVEQQVPEDITMNDDIKVQESETGVLDEAVDQEVHASDAMEEDSRQFISQNHSSIVEDKQVDVQENESSEGTPRAFRVDAMDEDKSPEFESGITQEQSPADVKLEIVDLNTPKKAPLKNISNGSSTRDGSQELADDLASVRLTSKSTSIEDFIAKTDPLSKMSNRNRPISIFNDSKAGSPQKVKEYDHNELNWFNFLMAKMSLDYKADDLQRYSKDDFVALCEQLSLGKGDSTSLATIMKYLRVSAPAISSTFLRNEGFGIAEQAAMEYLDREDANYTGGLMIIKQLLVNRYAVEIGRLWMVLLRLSGLEAEDSVHTLDIAVCETFEEALCGIYPSKLLFQISTSSLEEGAFANEGELRFALECVHKLASMDTLVLMIDEALIHRIDVAVRKHISHKKAEIRKLVIEVYGRLLRATRISQGTEFLGTSKSSEMLTSPAHEQSSVGAMSDILSALTTPQQRIIEFFSQDN